MSKNGYRGGGCGSDRQVVVVVVDGLNQGRQTVVDGEQKNSTLVEDRMQQRLYFLFPGMGGGKSYSSINMD
ncbi:hypothetical protein L1987_37676 [Smallanthus sonchifolius]|uniref:Uncharacterized protein n=1 Tax=Smallanthus sonchifolius TaxID=185202 RepID=A0ACB9HHF5_9ASTR|nr:hypothetical protein L1987_37676 [Smallanthus sonchifolius]